MAEEDSPWSGLCTHTQRTGQGRFSAYSSAAVQAVQYGTAVQYERSYGCIQYGTAVQYGGTVQYGPVLLGSGKVTIVTFWRQGTRRALVRWGSPAGSSRATCLPRRAPCRRSPARPRRQSPAAPKALISSTPFIVHPMKLPLAFATLLLVHAAHGAGPAVEVATTGEEAADEGKGSKKPSIEPMTDEEEKLMLARQAAEVTEWDDLLTDAHMALMEEDMEKMKESFSKVPDGANNKRYVAMHGMPP
eukprot:COSAG01_NODE_5917_length_3956_cov_40.956950_5_plen_245_part_01